MQMSKQIFNFQQAFYCWFISSNMGVAYKKHNCYRELIFAKQATWKKSVSSQLILAVETRQKPRKCGNFEGAWSLLPRAEVQDHLYVTTAAISLFPVPVT